MSLRCLRVAHLSGVALVAALAIVASFEANQEVTAEQHMSTSSLPFSSTVSGREAQRSKICQVTNGESVAIVEIEESNGTDVSQQTSPVELPIYGSKNDIELKIESASLDVFEIHGKRLLLSKPLNRDAQLKEQNTSQPQLELASQPVLSIYLQVSCKDRRHSTGAVQAQSPKVIIPVLVKILDINDNAPIFGSPIYSTQLNELAPLNTIVFDQVYALDLDAANNGLLQYSLSSAPPQTSLQFASPPVISRQTTSAAKRQDASITTTTPSSLDLDHTRLLSMELKKQEKHKPEATIDLESEPIFNGPTEVSDNDAEDSDDGDDSSDTSSNSTKSTDDKAKRRKRRRRRRRQTVQRPRSNSWTNLMAEDEASMEKLDLVKLAEHDSSEYFALELNSTTGRPIVRLRKQLDYESKRVHKLYLIATDKANKQAQRSSFTTLVVRVLDGDDQGPAFLLEQTGCATGMPLPTTIGPPPFITNYSRRSLDTEPSSAALSEFRLPKGFHVTEDEFEFGDGSGKSSGGPEEEKLLPFQSAPPDPKTQNQHQLVKMSDRGPSCLPGGNSASGLVEYFATAVSGQLEYLRISPQTIKARDKDELNAPISYSFLNGTPADYHNYFQINPLDGTVKQKVPVDIHKVQRFLIYVQAQEQTLNQLSNLARLIIEVVPSERGNPVLVANSRTGYVEENAPIGASVVTEKGGNQPVRFMLHNSSSSDLYQFETTTDAFKVNRDGFLVVNKWPLDRDAPQLPTHKFQVTVRLVGPTGSTSITSPIDLSVTLLDLNDNPPVIANSSLTPLQLSAGGTLGSSQPVTVIQVLDPDEEPENVRSTFSIVHVSNGGRDRFHINGESGLLETRGPFKVGEQFSVTLQVADSLGRTSQGILELSWIPGLNSAPVFLQLDKDLPAGRGDKFVAQVSEAAPLNTTVLQIRAKDPDNEPVGYSIVGGNINGDFQINPNTGTIQLAKLIDREEVASYILQVEARDSGGLTSVRPVTIQVLDINDQNPVFSSTNYTFSVLEGPEALKSPFGVVEAIDSDLGPNGELTYRLEPLSAIDQQDGQPLFAINETTGQLSLLKPLDYERARNHILTVSAIDKGKPPRISTQSVLVSVVDAQDELPYFETSSIESQLAENGAVGLLVAQAQAVDPDASGQITYVLVAGNASLFQVDPLSGQVNTTAPLDHEEKPIHTIIVGIRENNLSLMSGSGTKRSAICEIRLRVLDVNDNAPQFKLDQSAPIRVLDSASMGEQVTRVEAKDADTSPANSDIRYEISTRTRRNESRLSEPCSRSFMIDATSGVVAVKSDLRLEHSSECNLIVCASDSGLPSLESCMQVTVFIDHLVDSQSASIGFSEPQYSLEIPEDIEAGKLVKVLGVVHKSRGSRVLVGCDIVSGNEDVGVFRSALNEQLDCEIRTSPDSRHKLDYESKRQFLLQVRLNIPGFISSKTFTQVSIGIIDVNDNAPAFQPALRYMHLTQNKYLASVASDAPSESQVLKMIASDLDSPRTNGFISYELLNGNREPESRFKVSPTDGIIRTSKPVEDVVESKLPLHLRVLARDNPEPPAKSLDSVAEVLVNLIDDRHRVALVVRDTSTSQLLDAKEELLSVIQERSGLIANFERAESLKLLTNGSLEPDVSGTDFWFHLIEPGSFRVIETDDPRVRSSLFEERSRSSLLDVIGQTLGLTKTRLRLPYISLSRNPSASMNQNQSAFGRGFMWFIIGLSIAIVLVLLCQCATWQSTGSRTGRFLNEKPPLFVPNYYPPANHLSAKPPLPSVGSLDGPPRLAPAGQSGYQPFMTGSYTRPDDFSANTVKQARSLLEPSIFQLQNQLHQQQQQHQYNSMSKEYETQMLKLSLLFDDSQSVGIGAANQRLSNAIPNQVN